MTALRHSKTALTVSLALAVAMIVIGGLSFQRKLDTFRDPGLTLAQESGRRPTIEWVDSQLHPELFAGDQILLVNGDTATSVLSVLKELGDSDRADLVILRGDAQGKSVTFVRPPLSVDYSYLVQVLIGAVYLLIGLYTVLRQQSRQHLLFYLWCLVSSAFFILVSTPLAVLTIDDLGKAIYILEEIARLLLPPLTLHFFLSFPKQVAAKTWGRRLIPFLYLPSAVLASLQADLMFNSGSLLAGSPTAAALGDTLRLLDRIDLLLFAVYAIAAGSYLLYQSARDIPREEKRQFLWIALGMGGGYTPFLLLYVVPFSLGIEGPTALQIAAVLPLALVPLAFAYAILRYRLWDVTIIARDVATYTLTLLFGVLGFSFLRLIVDFSLPETATLGRNLLSMVAAVIVGGLLLPARQRIGSTLERAFYRSGFSKRRALATLGRDLLHERDLRSLCRLLLDQLEDGLGLESANILLAEGDRLLPVRFEEESLGNVALDDFGEQLWQQDFQTLSGIGLPDGAPSSAQRLFAHGYRYLFPLTVRDRRVGVLVSSYRLDDMPLSSEDQDLIRQVLNQAALAIENAYLLDHLQQQLKEVRELKQYNEGIIEASPAGIAVIDQDSRIVSANLAFSALVGADQGATRRRRLEQLLPIDRLPEPEEGLVELAVMRAGQECHLQLSVAPFSTDGSSDLKVLIIADVTERIAMEKDLEEKGRLAALGVMAAGIAHEINTPLTGISSYAQMLLQETPPEDPRYSLLRKVERQTFRASRIVNSLLSLARNQDQPLQPVDLNSVLDECADLLSEQLRNANVELHLSAIEPDLVVTALDAELQQVFTNLMLNSIEAMKQSGGELTVTAHRSGSWIDISFEDTGPGIPASTRERIFEPFYSTKHDQGGTGLGLSISAEIVRRSGGELRLEQPPTGSGCRFVVRLEESGG